MAHLTADQWQTVQRIFHEATALSGDAERTAFVEEQTQGFPHVRSMVQAMLQEHQHTHTLFDDPAAALATLLPSGKHLPEHSIRTEHVQALPHHEQPAEAQPEEQVGPYRLVRLIGRGGMGSVYLAERNDGAYEQQVAIKIIRRGLDTEDLLRRFQVERQILATLVHPNIAWLLDGGQLPDGRSYLVMEYIDGVPITTYCDANKLTIDQRLHLFLQVCEAVHFAHQNLVVHRDLKPQNILVTPKGEVKLLDFGIAKLLDPSATSFTVALTQDVLRLLTPEYAAPEQIRGEAITTSTDVYSLGVLLFELLAGQRPYELNSRVQRELERVICEVTPTAPSTVVATAKADVAAISAQRQIPAERLKRRLKEGLDDIALFALRKEPQRRYRSVQGLANDISHYLSGLPLEAKPDHWAYQARLFIRRHTVVVAASMLVLLSLVGGLGVALWQGRIAAQERETATREAERAHAVTDFLVQSFRASTPNAARIDTLSVVEWLDLSVQDIHQSFADQPALYREMLMTVGDVYRILGRYDASTPLLEQAHTLTQQMAAVNTVERAAADNLLGRLYYELGDYRHADTLLASALAQFMVLEDAPRAALARENYANARYYYENDRETALALHLENLAYYQSIEPLPLELLAHVLNDVHRMYLALGDQAMAMAYAEESVRVRRQVDDGGLLLAHGLNNMGILKTYEPADLTAAEAFFRESLDLYQKVYPHGHYRTTYPLFPLADILWKQGELAVAESLFTEGMHMRRAQYPEGHFMIAEGLLTVADMLHAQGRYEEALSAYRESYTNYRVSRGETYRRTIEAQQGLVDVLKTLGRHEEAAQYAPGD